MADYTPASVTNLIQNAQGLGAAGVSTSQWKEGWLETGTKWGGSICGVNRGLTLTFVRIRYLLQLLVTFVVYVALVSYRFNIDAASYDRIHLHKILSRIKQVQKGANILRLDLSNKCRFPSLVFLVDGGDGVRRQK